MNGLQYIADEHHWGMEENDDGAFYWTRPLFRLTLGNDIDTSFVTIKLASLVSENSILLKEIDGERRYPLILGWQTIDIDTRQLVDSLFGIETVFRADGDDRELGIMISEITFHANQELHEVISGRHRNLMLNNQEYERGSEVLQSIPPYLRITVSEICNIANDKPCVYCAWDWAKKLEKGAPRFDLGFIQKLGRFVGYATEVNDCSVGEPLMEIGFDGIVDFLTTGGRRFELTSNGQPLSKKMRETIIGKTVTLHISIDAATSRGYRRYRDHRFDLIINNLRALNGERGKNNSLRIVITFIVMQSNRTEIRDFVKLMSELGVDSVKFRTLYKYECIENVKVDHHGQVFDYDKEFLESDELDAEAKRCVKYGEKFGVPVIVEWSEFSENQSPVDVSNPLCGEPWKTAYILNRGLMPCCYGEEPLMTWDEIDLNDVEQCLHNGVNSDGFVEIRRDLARGRLSSYCKRTRSCPIVRKVTGN